MGSNYNSSLDTKKHIKKRHRMNETEKLIRDTILHESKSIKTNNASLVVNGLLDFTKPRNKTIIRNSRASEVADALVCKPKKQKLDKELSKFHIIQGEKRPINSLNGISLFAMSYGNSKNPLRDAGEGDHIICHQIDNCMRIVLNNTARHNVLTVNVSCTLATFEHRHGRQGAAAAAFHLGNILKRTIVFNNCSSNNRSSNNGSNWSMQLGVHDCLTTK